MDAARQTLNQNQPAAAAAHPAVDGGDRALAPAMALALAASFGSVERWREDFIAQATAPMAGRGAVQLCFQPQLGRLVHQRVTGSGPDLAAAQPPAGSLPLLWLDLDGTDRLPDPGTGQHGRVQAFVDSVPWALVYERYQAAVASTSDHLGLWPHEVQAVRLLDVRRAAVYAQSDAVIPGATWADPQAVGDWAAALPAGQPVVVYCVYGHEVGRAVALRLHAAGVNARFVHGGITGWQAAGRPVQPKPRAA